MGKASAVGALGLLLWKLKTFLLLALTKGKALLFGLTKMQTLLSMFLSMGFYWTLWGWKFAVGFVLSIYVHEMGHVMALRRLGIAATAPMFIPGVGAFIRAKQYPATPSDDAEVGLAGPLWGMGAALGCLAMAAVTDSAYWVALAHVGGWVNLFNLLPIWQLDGGRGFNALTRKQRWWMVGILLAAWALSGVGLLLLLVLGAVFRAVRGVQAEREDRGAFVKYALLVAVLAWLSTLGLELPGHASDL